jgi:hypothetical protein
MRVAAAPPTPFDALSGSPLILHDGTVATIRSAGPGDRHAVRTFFHELSEVASPAIAAPLPSLNVWLSNYGEPLLRFCSVPTIFVPESPNSTKRRRHDHASALEDRWHPADQMTKSPGKLRCHARRVARLEQVEQRVTRGDLQAPEPTHLRLGELQSRKRGEIARPHRIGFMRQTWRKTCENMNRLGHAMTRASREVLRGRHD